MFSQGLLSRAFNPKVFGTCTLWLDAMNPAGNGTQPGDGTSVSSWTDLSGTGNTMSQGIGSFQPVFKTNIINGKPVVRFDGTNDYMSKVVATALSSKNTFFIVSNIRDNGGGRGTVFDYAGAATNTGTNFLVQGGSYIAGFYDGTLHQASTSVTLPASNVYTIYNDGSSGFIYTKTTQIASVATGNTDNAGTRSYLIGALQGLVALYFLNGDIGEVMFFSGQLSASYQASIIGYLSGKWGF